MSNDPVRLTFPDGTQLFTMGDSWSVRMDRLFDTKEEAREMYNNDYKGYVNTTPEELSIAEQDEEAVLIETTYGSRDRSFREMLTFICKASKSSKIITFGPSYPDASGYP